MQGDIQCSYSTCECLTQTLYCHGCGCIIGYMIVTPCVPCTSSSTPTNRVTNGHRFIFYSNAIVATERHYIPDEPGVNPIEPHRVAMSPTTTAAPPAIPVLYQAQMASAHRDGNSSYSSSPRSRSPHMEYLPTPPPELGNHSSITNFAPGTSHLILETPPLPSLPHAPRPIQLSEHLSYSHYPVSMSLPSQDLYPTFRRPSSATSSQSSNSSPPPLLPGSYSFGSPAEPSERPPTRVLKAGDIIFWHHLSRRGEIPGVVEDERARSTTVAPRDSDATGVLFAH